VRFAFILLVLGALVLVVRFIPENYLSPSLQTKYSAWFGETAYREAPKNRATNIPTLQLDDVCSPEFEQWRQAAEIDGAHIAAVDDCIPDNPWDIAVSVRGANNVSDDTLMRSLLAPDSVEKSDDRDGDGDPDVIHIRLEVMELNGKSPDGPEVVPQFEIGPGITPGFWVFAPKTQGMTTENFESLVANRMIRLPAPVIRIEQGDEVYITLENAHYLPHTIHFHGLDHPFQTAEGDGNDGVPLFSEHAVMPGAARTYEIHPRETGTTFYHCHVQPHAHILMGLQGMLVVEENKPNNWLQTFNIGAGRVRVPSVASRETHDREYDLHYLEIDSSLNNRIQEFNDPRLISRSVHRGYNVTKRRADYFVLNGRSFPYTLRESLVVVGSGEKNLLHVLNGGAEGLALHLHGHKPTMIRRDGVALGAGREVQRDVFWIASAQRLDLTLNTTNDGLNAYGAGAWLMHDHREQAVTSNGIGPGGDVSLVVYEDFLAERGLPKTVGGLQDLAPFFLSEYYTGQIPVFAGMHGHEILDPEVVESDVRKVWLFWFGVFITAISPLLARKVRWRAR
jgi:manganese oxidase